MQSSQSHAKTILAVLSVVVSCASAPPVVRSRPDVLSVPPVAAYVMPEGLESFPAVPVTLPRPGILISEAEATRALLERSELSARRVETRGLRAVLTVERASFHEHVRIEAQRADRAQLTAQRWRSWGPWGLAAALATGLIIGISAAPK